MPAYSNALSSLGISERDPLELPSSEKRFADGGQFRIEIAGIERLSVLEAMLDEMKSAKVPVHRIVAAITGGMLLTMDELKGIARLAREARVEVLLGVGPRGSYDIGASARAPDGAATGSRLRGADQLAYAIQDVQRSLSAGIRGFNIADEGLLWALNEMRKAGEIPRNVILKASIATNHGNPAGMKVLEILGADSINPNADLTLPMIAALRKATSKSLSIFITNLDASGGFVRFYEAPEIVRIASPVYLKIEPGVSLATHYRAHSSPKVSEELARVKVRQAAIVLELINKMYPEAKMSPQGSDDSALPEPSK